MKRNIKISVLIVSVLILLMSIYNIKNVAMFQDRLPHMENRVSFDSMSDNTRADLAACLDENNKWDLNKLEKTFKMPAGSLVDSEDYLIQQGNVILIKFDEDKDFNVSWDTMGEAPTILELTIANEKNQVLYHQNDLTMSVREGLVIPAGFHICYIISEGNTHSEYFFKLEEDKLF